jgi:hypothetical protein
MKALQIAQAADTREGRNKRGRQARRRLGTNADRAGGSLSQDDFFYPIANNLLTIYEFCKQATSLICSVISAGSILRKSAKICKNL